MYNIKPERKLQAAVCSRHCIFICFIQLQHRYFTMCTNLMHIQGHHYIWDLVTCSYLFSFVTQVFTINQLCGEFILEWKSIPSWIWYPCSSWIYHRWLKFFHMDNNNLFIMYNQCNGCWWPECMANHQDISRHGITVVILEYLGLSSRRIKWEKI